ncbi:AMP-binding enzyme [Lichenicoccus roseus]|uniref:AMP-binding enzyme C-terminal domain-containing protein n=1 Tax=Lichenicoccus roseus TaxID=2683649 RepID=A0A5R9J9E0_9PROT|nr:hypothetical protein [Lichenicoccus roseus]TLU74234.1 hypothetical protein FE263_03280 [Lichenicoccus roseus]
MSTPLGDRVDGAVQVGGVNVLPIHVAAVLLSHPGVAAATVRLMRPSEGIRLKAFVVAEDPFGNQVVLRAELEALAAVELAIAEQPRASTFGPVLPAGDMGKATDWQITQVVD